jgi:transposase
MTRKVKVKVNINPSQKLEYAKLMIEEGYTNKQIQDISGACSSAISRWKNQYKAELEGHQKKRKCYHSRPITYSTARETIKTITTG